MKARTAHYDRHRRRRLNRYDPKTDLLHRLPKKTAANNIINGILEDRENNLWLSTNYGLS